MYKKLLPSTINEDITLKHIIKKERSKPEIVEPDPILKSQIRFLTKVPVQLWSSVLSKSSQQYAHYSVSFCDENKKVTNEIVQTTSSSQGYELQPLILEAINNTLKDVRKDYSENPSSIGIPLILSVAFDSIG